MNNQEYEFVLLDRIAKIQAINEQYDLENNSYIAFSGGKDSVVLSKLIDLALPNNHIPRVFINTGIEYIDMVKYVKEIAKNDDRIIIVNQTRNIKKTLDEYGYPFKSKPHAKMVGIYQRNGLTDYVKDYIDPNKKTKYRCSSKLLYQFSNDFKLKLDYKCCVLLKENPSLEWSKKNKKAINITGLRAGEGSSRANINCVITDNNNNLRKFHPLLVVSEEWENNFIYKNNIKLCKLYYPPFNFRRTGCKCCPFSLTLQKDLEILHKLLPNEYKQCLYLWKPVYDEYIRIGYRLKEYPHKQNIQMTIDDYLGDDNNGT